MTEEELLEKNEDIQMEEKKKKEELQEKFRQVSDEDKEKAFNDALGIDLVQTKSQVNIKAKLGSNLKKLKQNSLVMLTEGDDFDHVDLGLDDDDQGKSVTDMAR